MAEDTTIYFGEADFRNKNTPFGLKPKDPINPIYGIGKTGMGKSILLENLAIQDIRMGNGLGFIDPHGGTAEKLLDFIPEERANDVIYFAPFDTEYPVSFNVLEDVGKDQRHLVADGLMAAFKKIWPDVWSARMEYILNNILLALLEYPDSTLLGVNRMLADKAYRDAVVNHISDPAVKAFWTDEFARYTDRFMTEAGAAIQNKIGQFTASPLIRNLIGQPKSTFNIRELMDNRKILIMNLSKGRIGENNAGLIGGMLITKIYLAAMSRANMTDADIARLPTFYFYVDEFQTFVNDSFADILAEARKYKLALTIAHQYIEQMPETVRNAVFGNVGTTISFRVGPFDAEVLEKVFAPRIMALDLVNLGAYQIYLTLMIDGIGSPPFSARTLPPITPPEQSLKVRVIESSRKYYARPRDVVEAEILAWHKPIGAGGGESGMGMAGAPRSAPSQNQFQSSGSGHASAMGSGERHKRKRKRRSGEGVSVSSREQSHGSSPAGSQVSGGSTTRPMNLRALIDRAMKAQEEEPEQEEEEAGMYKKGSPQILHAEPESRGQESQDGEEFEEEEIEERDQAASPVAQTGVQKKVPQEIPEQELKKMLEV